MPFIKIIQDAPLVMKITEIWGMICQTLTLVIPHEKGIPFFVFVFEAEWFFKINTPRNLIRFELFVCVYPFSHKRITQS